MSKVAALPRPGQRPDETALAGPAAVRAGRRGGAGREAGAAKKKVLIDADPGTDDALALIAALNSPELDVLGVTTVGGNASLADTTRNALRLLDHLGSDLPVSRGSARPLKGRFEYAYHFHGAAGLGVRLPSPRTAPTAERAVERIVGAASEYRGALTLIALGPLTNVARAMRSNPRLAGWVAEVVVMGGAVEVPGNVTPHAEFNVYNDPEAAHEVLTSRRAGPADRPGRDHEAAPRQGRQTLGGRRKRAGEARQQGARGLVRDASRRQPVPPPRPPGRGGGRGAGPAPVRECAHGGRDRGLRTAGQDVRGLRRWPGQGRRGGGRRPGGRVGTGAAVRLTGPCPSGRRREIELAQAES